MLTQLKDVESVLVNFLQLFKCLWLKVEHSGDERFSQARPQLSNDLSFVISLLLKGETVVFETEPARLICKLIVPGFQFLPHVDLAEVGWIVVVPTGATHVRVTFIGGVNCTTCNDPTLISTSLISLEVEILLV